MKNENPLVSLIIPVYNVEKYLRKSLQSAADQTFKSMEIIVINDGSTDGSSNIIKEFSNKYDNFRVIEQENKGLAYSRNIGLKEAKGEYIAFLDSDDYISKDYVKILYNMAKKNNADIACCNFNIYYPNLNFSYYMPFTSRSRVYKSDSALKKLIRDITIHYYSWNKLCKKSIFVNNNLCFTDMFFEDIAMSPNLFYFANKVVVTSKALYYYTRRSGSILSTMNVKKINDYIKAFGKIREFLEEQNDYKKFVKSYKFQAYRVMLVNYYSIFRVHLKKQNFCGFLQNIRNSNNSIKYFSGSDYFKLYNDNQIPFEVEEPQKKSKNNKRKIKSSAQG